MVFTGNCFSAVQLTHGSFGKRGWKKFQQSCDFKIKNPNAQPKYESHENALELCCLSLGLVLPFMT